MYLLLCICILIVCLCILIVMSDLLFVFCFIVLYSVSWCCFVVLFVCKRVLFNRHRVTAQLQLINISIYITSLRHSPDPNMAAAHNTSRTLPLISAEYSYS